MKFSQSVQDFERYLLLDMNRSANTIQSYRRDLTKFQAYLTEQGIDKVEAIDEVTVRAFLAKLSQDAYAASSTSRMLSSLKQRGHTGNKSHVAGPSTQTRETSP